MLSKGDFFVWQLPLIVTPLPILVNYDSKVWDHFVDEISDVLLGIKEFIPFLFP